MYALISRTNLFCALSLFSAFPQNWRALPLPSSKTRPPTFIGILRVLPFFIAAGNKVEHYCKAQWNVTSRFIFLLGLHFLQRRKICRWYSVWGIIIIVLRMRWLCVISDTNKLRRAVIFCASCLKKIFTKCHRLLACLVPAELKMWPGLSWVVFLMTSTGCVLILSWGCTLYPLSSCFGLHCFALFFPYLIGVCFLWGDFACHSLFLVRCDLQLGRQCCFHF